MFDRPISCEFENPSRIPTKQRVLNEISSGIFWNQYKRLDSPRDGHCFIQTLVNSFNSQFPDKPCMLYNQLLQIIEEETLHNINIYNEFLENASHTVTIEYMRRYISDKIYDMPYGDSVPLIASCGIKQNNFIVEKIGDGYDIKCIDSSGKTTNEKHPVLKYKHDDHYDTIERSRQSRRRR